MEINHQIDETYEFSAPHYFDFSTEETEEQIRKAVRWFEISHSYAPSPTNPKIRKSRSVLDDPRDFEDEENFQKASDACGSNIENQEKMISSEACLKNNETSFAFPILDANASPANFEALTPKFQGPLIQEKSVPAGLKNQAAKKAASLIKQSSQHARGGSKPRKSAATNSSSEACLKNNDTSFAFPILDANASPANFEALTPNFQRPLIQEKAVSAGLKNQAPKKSASLIKHSSQHARVGSKSYKSAAAKCINGVNTKNAIFADIALENQAIKRQKLDGGCSKKIHNVKPAVLLHKSKLDLHASDFKSYQEQQKEVAPYISAAEMVRKFESRTREIELPKNTTFTQGGTISLTRPKEPELQTVHRVRAIKIKSSAELEEEMLAKIPKFKARPLNKKILQAPSLPALLRSIPQPPDFHEFHLKTMERANQNVETSSIASSVNPYSSQACKPLKLTNPKPPVLETEQRARPTKAKSTQELELEELEKLPKFKARPLNNKILTSKGELGLLCKSKSQITTPQEFHFSTDDRLGPPPSTMVELFDKLSLHSESSLCNQQNNPKITKPNPFHLHTEDRGLVKEQVLAMKNLQKQFEEERARIPKANPYPYSTDYPVIPPKPQPKQTTKPEVFCLESLIRHEGVVHKKMEEIERAEREEAERRKFKAQPIMKDDPIPLPAIDRKPLTVVQEFTLHADQRASERSEFDKKVKEKELAFKRYREEKEYEMMIEEERKIKQMRRTLIPHARPVPKFDNPFLPQKSTKEITRPKSPNLLVDQRERRNRHIR